MSRCTGCMMELEIWNVGTCFDVARFGHWYFEPEGFFVELLTGEYGCFEAFLEGVQGEFAFAIAIIFWNDNFGGTVRSIFVWEEEAIPKVLHLHFIIVKFMRCQGHVKASKHRRASTTIAFSMAIMCKSTTANTDTGMFVNTSCRRY